MEFSIKVTQQTLNLSIAVESSVVQTTPPAVLSVEISLLYDALECTEIGHVGTNHEESALNGEFRNVGGELAHLHIITGVEKFHTLWQRSVVHCSNAALYAARVFYQECLHQLVDGVQEGHVGVEADHYVCITECVRVQLEKLSFLATSPFLNVSSVLGSLYLRQFHRILPDQDLVPHLGQMGGAAFGPGVHKGDKTIVEPAGGNPIDRIRHHCGSIQHRNEITSLGTIRHRNGVDNHCFFARSPNYWRCPCPVVL